MEHKDVFILESIVEYCDKIGSVLSDIKNDEKTFLGEGKVQDLCAFYCLQIGENANSLSDTFKLANAEIDWRGIIGLRHNIAHEYGTIDAGILWNILQDEVPPLRQFCANKIGH